MSASLNEIYDRLGKLGAAMEAVAANVTELKRDIETSEARSDTSRANVHRRLDEMVMRTTHLETDMQGVKNRVDKVQGVTDEIRALRQQALGAGTLGVWLWKIGGWIITAAAGFMAAYTWLTGRPPP